MSPALLAALVIGTVLPALTAVVTKDTASAKLKAALTAGIGALTAAVTTALYAPPHGGTAWEELAAAVAVSWAASAVAYFAGWKPTGAVAAIHRRTARFGLTDAADP
ncbi:MAG: hypothetical protein KGH75_00175 [Rhodospirillales bacterium]|nr:hypothetical protein [Rhodospirillales bacterium]